MRNLKVLSAALMVVCLTTALLASSAQAAEGKLTATEGLTSVVMTLLKDEGAQATTVNNGKISCNGFSSTVSTSLIPAQILTIHPNYTECKAFGLSATVTTTGCNYVFTLKEGTLGTAQVSTECESGKSITIKATGTNCVITTGPQVVAEHILFTNKVDNENFDDITIDMNIANGTKYTETGTNCVKNGVTSENGKYEGTLTLKGWRDISGTEGARAHILVS